MQYQVLDEDGKLVAWIDTNQQQQIVLDGYTIVAGDNLHCIEIEDGITTAIKINLNRGD